MSEQNKIEILNVLNSLEIIDQNGGDDAYMLVANTPETRERLSQLGVSSETIRNYGDDETFCILALAFGEGYATDYKSGVGLIYEEKKIDEIKAYVERCEEEGYKFQHLDNLKYLLQEIERKDKALRFYADEETYEEKWEDSAECWTDPEIEGDRGEIAREAL